MNLTQEFPRSPKQRLAGLAHVPRMRDKARADRQKTMGEYMYPCPMDKIMLEFMGVDAKTFQQKACDDTEEALARWIAEQCQNRSPDEMTAVNQKLLSSQPDNPDSWQSFYEIRDGVDASRTDITTWAGLIDLDEGRC